jgi:hypothetical protein
VNKAGDLLYPGYDLNKNSERRLVVIWNPVAGMKRSKEFNDEIISPVMGALKFKNIDFVRKFILLVVFKTEFRVG